MLRCSERLRRRSRLVLELLNLASDRHPALGPGLLVVLELPFLLGLTVPAFDPHYGLSLDSPMPPRIRLAYPYFVRRCRIARHHTLYS